MMELTLRISSNGTEHGNTASKTILSERRKAPRDACRRLLLAARPGAAWPLQQRRGQGGGGGDPPGPSANGAS